jgi:phytoene desaturase
VPNLAAGHDWERSGSLLRERVLDALQSPDGLGLECLRESIEFEASWTPLDFRDRLGAVDGNAFAAEPTLRQSAYFRTPNRDRRLSGLYYVGAGTHPGAGIPGVLLGAEVTAGLIARDTVGRP